MWGLPTLTQNPLENILSFIFKDKSAGFIVLIMEFHSNLFVVFPFQVSTKFSISNYF